MIYAGHSKAMNATRTQDAKLVQKHIQKYDSLTMTQIAIYNETFGMIV
jgi:hypothetical protein